jgi:hypothetical protein
MKHLLFIVARVEYLRHDVELTVLCAAKDETSVEFIRPLLNSWAECSVVMSCGKVDSDKSGQRGDERQMWRLCMSDSRIQRRETRFRWNA